MTDTAILNPADVEQFAGQLMSIYTGSMLNYMIDIGHRTGLFTAAARGPATSQDLAGRAGLTERYVREWLGAMVTSRIFTYDPTTQSYALPAAHAAVLTDGGMNLAPMSALGTHLGKHVHQVARAFREGGGVPYSEFRPEFTDVMDGISRVFFDSGLIDLYLPLVPGLTSRLEAGIQVADVACGTGHALVVLGRAFPASTFVGYDLDDGAIGRARAEAAGARLANVTFEVLDAARLDVEDRYDLVFVFDAVHDQVDPSAVLANIQRALAPGGVFFMKEPHGADALEDNLENPMAPLLYSVSTLHCMTVSLAHGGAGIGTVFGEQLACRMLAEARFVDVEVQPAPGDPGDAVYLAAQGTVTAVWARRLAWGAIVAQLVFVGSWLLGGVIERHGYSVASDDISDLGALTAHHPTLVLVAFGISGALTIAFALGAVRPALGLGGWLLALSLPALDNLSDAFFRLDCRAADAGCSTSSAAASWHGKVHIAVFLVAAVAAIATPFVLSRAMKHTDGWRDLASWARIFGVVVVVGGIANVALTGTSVQGLAQRTLAVIVPLGIVALAVRVLQLNAVGLPGGKPMSNALRVYETST